MISNWLGLPYPLGWHLRCDPYHESLGSLRAYYYNPHIIIISQSYCSLCMPKARGGMLRIVSIKALELVNIREDKGDKSAATPFDSRNRVIRTKRGLSRPDSPPTDHSSSSPSKQQLSKILIGTVVEGKTKSRIKWHRCGSSFDPVSSKFPWHSLLHGSSRRGDSSIMRCPVSYYIELKRRQARVNILGSSSTTR